MRMFPSPDSTALAFRMLFGPPGSIRFFIPGRFGRGSWIRTNDLQYPKLPRYQAALYPDHLGNHVDTRLVGYQQGWLLPLTGR